MKGRGVMLRHVSDFTWELASTQSRDWDVKGRHCLSLMEQINTSDLQILRKGEGS